MNKETVIVVLFLASLYFFSKGEILIGASSLIACVTFPTGGFNG